MQNKEVEKTYLEINEAVVDTCLALAWAYDTQDLRVPWDWRAAHMREIEERTCKNKHKQDS